MQTKIFFLFIGLLTGYRSGAQIIITFTIDVTGFEVGTGGMHIAGQFATDSSISITEDWAPGVTGSAMTLLSGSAYQLNVTFPFSAAGKLLEFEFVRDSTWNNASGDVSEGNPTDCCLDLTCGVSDQSGGINRIITIPDCSGTYNCAWNICSDLIAAPTPAITVTPGNVLICKGDSIQLNASSIATVNWQADATLSCWQCNNPIASPDTTTYYYVTATIGNCVAAESIFVEVVVPTVKASSDTLLCNGASAQLSATGEGNILWSPSAGLSCTMCDNPVASPTSTILYYVSAAAGSCLVKDSILITVDAISINAGNDEQLLLGDSVQLNADGASQYSWQPPDGLSCIDCASPVAVPIVTTTYTLTGTSENGCKAIDELTIEVIVPCDGIFFPNAFTPNGDGRNETFGPISDLHPPIKAFRIHNRWGQLVFESNNFSGQWNGNFHGEPQPLGAYVYDLELVCDGGTVVLKGLVSLIR
ncbi:MAG: gliding motility-associated C-terminal domain-containing protein [Chitinophagales bacterium]